MAPEIQLNPVGFLNPPVKVDRDQLDSNAGEATLHTSNLPTKIIPTKICWLKISGEFPMDVRIPPL